MPNEIVKDKEALRTVCKHVDNEELCNKIAKELKATLDATQTGVGLCASQIGYDYRIFIFRNAKQETRTLVNASIVERSHPSIYKREGCLSFPGVWLSTIRYEEVLVEHGLTERKQERFRNFSAVVCQHEIDHHNGVLFFDREIPGKYDPCFCGSDEKFKFCCLKAFGAKTL